MVEVRYITADELMKDAKPTNCFKEAQEAFMKAHSGELVDPVALRRMQDWSYLSGQVVGAEVPRRYD